MDVDEMVMDVFKVLCSYVFTKHGGDFFADDGTVDLDIFIFVKFRFHCCYVFRSDIGVGVNDGAICGITCCNIIFDEVELAFDLFSG